MRKSACSVLKVSIGVPANGLLGTEEPIMTACYSRPAAATERRLVDVLQYELVEDGYTKGHSYRARGRLSSCGKNRCRPRLSNVVQCRPYYSQTKLTHALKSKMHGEQILNRQTFKTHPACKLTNLTSLVNRFYAGRPLNV